MMFRYREGEPRASSFMSGSNPQPRPSLEELRRELEVRRLKVAIIASRIAQCRMVEEERLHEMRMWRHPTLPQPLMVLPPGHDLLRNRFDAYLDPVQRDRSESVPDEDEKSVSNGAVRDEGGSSRSSPFGFEKKASIDHKKKKRALSAGKKKIKKKKKKKNGGLWCRICKVRCSGKEAMKSHLSGKKHTLALTEKAT